MESGNGLHKSSQSVKTPKAELTAMAISKEIALAIGAYGDEMWNLGSGFPARVAETRDAMIKEIEKALKPAYWWDAEEWDVTYDDVGLLTDNLGYNEPMEIGRAARLSEQWVVKVATIWTDVEQILFFDTLEEAQSAIAAAPEV